MRTVRLSPILALLALSLSVAMPVSAADDAAPQEAAPVTTEESPSVIAPPPAPVPLPVSDVGRYRLFDGQYAASAITGEQTSERHLFKIDSVTGSVWVGRQVQFVDKKSGRLVQQRYWEPFEQYLTSSPTK